MNIIKNFIFLLSFLPVFALCQEHQAWDVEDILDLDMEGYEKELERTRKAMIVWQQEWQFVDDYTSPFYLDVEYNVEVLKRKFAECEEPVSNDYTPAELLTLGRMMRRVPYVYRESVVEVLSEENICSDEVILYCLINNGLSWYRDLEEERTREDKEYEEHKKENCRLFERICKKDVNVNTTFYVRSPLFPIEDRERTLLGCAVRKNRSDVVEILLRKGANPSLKDDVFRVTPLAMAASNRNRVIGAMLIEAGVNYLPTNSEDFCDWLEELLREMFVCGRLSEEEYEIKEEYVKEGRKNWLRFLNGQ